jgi:deoxyribodipyrimidine photo-lyase
VNIHVLWWRDDFRLRDNATLHAAMANADHLLCVTVDDSAARGPWPMPFARQSAHRRVAWQHATSDVHRSLTALGHSLWVASGPPAAALARLVDTLRAAYPGSAVRVFTQAIPAPFERDDVQALAAHVPVNVIDASDLLRAQDVGFEQPTQAAAHRSQAKTAHALSAVPSVFTAFRKHVEQAGMPVRELLPAPQSLPSMPGPVGGMTDAATHAATHAAVNESVNERVGAESLRTALAAQGFSDAHTASPALDVPAQFDQALEVSERAGLEHMKRYFSSDWAHHYKATRNGLMGPTYATKLSLWLARGCLSPVMVWHTLKAFEARRGASKSSYWIGFELLWREHFRWLHKRDGVALYRRGSAFEAAQPRQFERWCNGQTGSDFVNAGMHELRLTGCLSNRMRQVVASYWLHECAGDWRWGAAWFEHALLDFDVMSNTGNWLYIAGLGSDPQGGRRFDVQWQAQTHDPQGHYTRYWFARAKA